MKTNHSVIAVIIAVLFEILVVSNVILNIIFNRWENFRSLFLAIVCTFIPFFIRRIADKKKIELPNSFELVSVVFIILTIYVGDNRKLYAELWWWDLLMHALFGSYAVLMALSLNKGVIVKSEECTKKRYSILNLIFAFSFSIMLGAVWEVFEFVGDYILKTEMVKGGIEDTVTDLMMKILAALVTCIFIYLNSSNLTKELREKS